MKTKAKINKKKYSVAQKAKIWSIAGWIVIGVLVALTIVAAIVYFVKVKSIPAIDTGLEPSEYQAELEKAYATLRPYLIWFIISQALCVFSAIVFFSVQSTFTSNYIIHKDNKK